MSLGLLAFYCAGVGRQLWASGVISQERQLDRNHPGVSQKSSWELFWDVGDTPWVYLGLSPKGATPKMVP